MTRSGWDYDRHQFATRQDLRLIGLLENILDASIVGFGDFDGDADRHMPAFDGTEQPIFAAFDQPYDAPDIFQGEIRLAVNLGIVIAASLHPLDIVEQVDRTMLAPGEILDPDL